MTDRFSVPRRDQNGNPQGLTGQELDARLRGARQAQEQRLAGQIGSPGVKHGASDGLQGGGRTAPDAPAQKQGGAGR